MCARGVVAVAATGAVGSRRRRASRITAAAVGCWELQPGDTNNRAVEPSASRRLQVRELSAER
jgi:hypothetical protein